MDKPDQLFKAFSDETRLRILNLLTERDFCVCEFQHLLRVPQPTVSRHLAYLRRAGLITSRQEGRWVHYGITPAPTPVQRALLNCVGTCVRKLDVLQEDLGKLGALRRRGRRRA